MKSEGEWVRGPDGPANRPGNESDVGASMRDDTASVKERAREKKEELQETASHKAEELKEKAARKTDEITSRFGGRIEAVARALRRAGEDMRNEGEPRFADMTDRAAGRVERFGSYLEKQDTHAMISDLEGSARSHPAVFVAGSFAAGLLLGRFLRSGEPESGKRASYVTGEADWSDNYLEDVGDPAFGEAR